MKLTFPSHPIPILILSDPPEALTGLARVGRDLASLLSTMPEFRVGYLARGGVGRDKFPWMQYSYPVSGQWGEEYLPQVWRDFSRGQNGVVFTNWDLSRMHWLAQPQYLPEPLRSFYSQEGRTFELWGYFPVDGEGPGEGLPTQMRSTALGFDRVLASSEWGCGQLKRVRKDADWLPHGMWLDKFRPTGRTGMTEVMECAKYSAGWELHGIAVGCNMANQARKDWPVAFETAALLRTHYGSRFHFWAHTDLLIHYWNLHALAADYGVEDCIEVTTGATDEELALRYSACDCTILPSGGEGFGYPIVESMACGTPCIVADYAAGQELDEEDCRVEPVAWRVDTIHNVRRAVLSGYGFAAKVKEQVERKRGDWEGVAEQMRARVEHLDWERLGNQWKRWFLEGVVGR